MDKIILIFLIYSFVCPMLIECRHVRDVDCSDWKHNSRNSPEAYTESVDPGVSIEYPPEVETKCVGTLISKRAVLTLASCVYETTEKPLECEKLQIDGNGHKVHGEKCIPHEEHAVVLRNMPLYTQNDIAIVIVSEDFETNDKFGSVKIGGTAPVKETKCFIAIPDSGAAETPEGEPDEEYRVNSRSLGPIEIDDCSAGITREKTFCGKTEGGECTASYGAGLICGNEVKGVFVDCDDANDVYVDVSAYKEWIKANSGNSITSIFAMTTLFGMINVSKILFN